MWVSLTAIDYTGEVQVRSVMWASLTAIDYTGEKRYVLKSHSH